MDSDEAFLRDLLGAMDAQTSSRMHAILDVDVSALLAAVDVDVLGPVLTALGIPDARLVPDSPKVPADADMEGSDTPVDTPGGVGDT